MDHNDLIILPPIFARRTLAIPNDMSEIHNAENKDMYVFLPRQLVGFCAHPSAL